MGRFDALTQLDKKTLPTSLRKTIPVQLVETQESGKPGTQEDGKVLSQLSRKPGDQESGKPGTQETIKRSIYPQQTFNIHPDVIDLLDDTKRVLRRKYNIKSSKEIIVEKMLRYICKNFQEMQGESIIVKLFNQSPDSQENGNPGK